MTSCSDRFDKAAELAAMAEAQFAGGNIEEARQNIQRAIIARDDVAAYFILLGRIELQSGKFPSAFNAYSRALDLQADNLEVLQAIAELGLQTDRLQEAEEAADRMLLLSPGSTRAMLVKGFLAIEANRLDDARRFADLIAAQDPTDEGGAILTARLQALDGDFAGGAATMLRTIAAVGDTEALNATLLEIYRAQGNAAGMRKAFPKVIAAAGKDSRYQLDFVNLLYKIGDIGAARNEAIRAIEAQPNDPVRHRALRQIFLEYDTAPLSDAQRDFFARSGTRATQLSLARFYLDSGQYEAARTMLARLAGEGAVEAQALSARIAVAQKQEKEADALVSLVLASDPRNPDALIARANRRLSQRKIDAAIEDANIVVSDAPQEYGGYAALANAYLAKGSRVRAQQVFERGIDFLPQSELLTGLYESFLRKADERVRIVSLYGELASAKPSSAGIWQKLSRVCREFDDRVCEAKAERGLAAAKQSFVIDEPPGTPRARGLFARITPEQICRSSGGICTGS
jgi:tetratricopeptide (TPR) repeat protein